MENNRPLHSAGQTATEVDALYAQRLRDYALPSALYDAATGKNWYNARDVCQALRVDPDAMIPKTPSDYKYRLFVYKRGYRSRRVLYISAGGVAHIIMLRGGLSRAVLMAALTEIPQPCSGIV